MQREKDRKERERKRNSAMRKASAVHDSDSDGDSLSSEGSALARVGALAMGVAGANHSSGRGKWMTLEEKQAEKQARIDLLKEELGKYASVGIKTDVLIRMLGDRFPTTIGESYMNEALQAVLTGKLFEFRKAIACLGEKHINRQFVEYNRRTLLHLCACNCAPGQIEREEAISIVQLLIKNFADFQICDNEGLNVVMAHAQASCLETVQYMLQKWSIDEPNVDYHEVFVLKECHAGWNMYELCLLNGGGNDVLGYLSRTYPKLVRRNKIALISGPKRHFGV